MKQPEILKEYQTLAVTQLRFFEERRAAGDTARLQELRDMTDAELIKRWMWKITIIGAPICFIAAPFTLSLLTAFLWLPLLQFLWTIARLAMGMVFIIFVLAIYFTVREPREHD